MKRIVETSEAPAAIGPYSQGVTFEGKLLFTAGQIGLNPSTGEMVEGGIAEQTAQALNNLREIVVAGRSSIDQVLKVNIYLTDIENFGVVNKIYQKYFDAAQPARAVVQVAALPKNALIEIDCIAAAK